MHGNISANGTLLPDWFASSLLGADCADKSCRADHHQRASAIYQPEVGELSLPVKRIKI